MLLQMQEGDARKNTQMHRGDWSLGQMVGCALRQYLVPEGLTSCAEHP
jgi:hypothetical protein